MRRNLILLAALMLGCSGRSYDVANPVVGPIPPRVSGAAEKLADSEGAAKSDIVQVKLENEPLSMTTVVATVNGRPILAGDILEQYESRLSQMRPKLTDSQYREAQLSIIKRDLPNIMEQTLMADAVRSKLTKDQLEAVEKQLDVFFEQEVDRLKERFKVKSLAELEHELQQQGTSLSTYRKMFGERQLAGEYVRARIGTDPPISRHELLEEYQRNLKDYAVPLKVKWQQLQISVAKAGNRAKAAAQMELALAELRGGTPFDEVVRKYSDGPLAANGGHWDWTQPESVANADVRKALETLPAGQMSNVLTSDNFLQIVKITGRQEAGHTPFGDVQEQIRKKLIEDRRSVKAKQVVEELKNSAVTTSIFGDDFFINSLQAKAE